RGITEAVLKKARAGYAPGGRSLRTYLEGQGYTKEELKEYRLVNEKGLDSFFHRAVIPVYLHRKVIDLYGRAVDEKASKVPHYYLDGSKVLGGIDQIDPDKYVLLFESAIDRLAAESHGLPNGVDSGGAHKFKS